MKSQIRNHYNARHVLLLVLAAGLSCLSIDSSASIKDTLKNKLKAFTSSNNDPVFPACDDVASLRAQTLALCEQAKPYIDICAQVAKNFDEADLNNIELCRAHKDEIKACDKARVKSGKAIKQCEKEKAKFIELDETLKQCDDDSLARGMRKKEAL